MKLPAGPCVLRVISFGSRLKHQAVVAGAPYAYDCDLSPGAIGFDRMAAVVVACRGSLVGLFKHPGKR